MTDELLVDCRGPVTRLTLNRAAKLNALNAALVDQFLAAIAVATGDGTRLFVVEGAGRGFSGGFDFGGLEQESDGDLVLRFVRLELLLAAVQHAPFATLALVHGPCFGAAADLVACCMHRIAAPDARFRMPGLRFGVVLGTRRLAALIGRDAARDLLATSKVFRADEAKRIGLVREVLDRSLWSERVAALAAEASALPGASQQALLRMTIPDTRDADLAELARAVAAPGLKARIAAYLTELAKAT
jgi:enoyl-CoA hydratase